MNKNSKVIKLKFSFEPRKTTTAVSVKNRFTESAYEYRGRFVWPI